MISGGSIQTYLELLRQNFRLNTLRSLVIGIVYLCSIPLIRGISNLNDIYAAECLEKSVALIGIILLVPICQPEQDKQIQEVILSKPFAHYKIIFMRLLLSLIAIIASITGFCILMLLLNCDFPFIAYVAGGCVSAVALGSVGFLTAAICNNVIIGYLSSSGYFLLNWIGAIQKGNIFYLFSMTDGSYIQKYWLFSFAILCLGGVLIHKAHTNKV